MSAVGIAGDGQVKSSSRKVRAIRAAIASMTSRRRVTATPRSAVRGVSVRLRLATHLMFAGLKSSPRPCATRIANWREPLLTFACIARMAAETMESSDNLSAADRDAPRESALERSDSISLIAFRAEGPVRGVPILAAGPLADTPKAGIERTATRSSRTFEHVITETALKK